MYKYCNGNWQCCSYSSQAGGTLGVLCNFDGYCDYQLPRDSRTKIEGGKLDGESSFGKD